jgi:hypothetical protein
MEKVGKRRITLEIPGEALLGLRVPLEEAGDVMRTVQAGGGNLKGWRASVWSTALHV